MNTPLIIITGGGGGVEGGKNDHGEKGRWATGISVFTHQPLIHKSSLERKLCSVSLVTLSLLDAFQRK